jgi:hypothetical protein
VTRRPFWSFKWGGTYDSGSGAARLSDRDHLTNSDLGKRVRVANGRPGNRRSPRARVRAARKLARASAAPATPKTLTQTMPVRRSSPGALRPVSSFERFHSRADTRLSQETPRRETARQDPAHAPQHIAFVHHRSVYLPFASGFFGVCSLFLRDVVDDVRRHALAREHTRESSDLDDEGVACRCRR